MTRREKLYSVLALMLIGYCCVIPTYLKIMNPDMTDMRLVMTYPLSTASSLVAATASYILLRRLL